MTMLVRKPDRPRKNRYAQANAKAQAAQTIIGPNRRRASQLFSAMALSVTTMVVGQTHDAVAAHSAQ